MLPPYTLPKLLQLAIEKGASDLHLSAGHLPVLRLDGDLQPVEAAVLTASDLTDMLYSLMSTAQQTKLATELSIDFAYALPETMCFRVNCYYQQHGIAAVFRLIPVRIPSMQELDLPSVLHTLVEKKTGLLLITGATGAGKSHSLAALIEQINQTQAKHIISIEDPIEFSYISKCCLITQRQIPRDALSFHAALRAALRQDPDIICITELRDLETIRLALTAAETGHLVLATLHTASASQTIDRIVDVFPGNEKEVIRAMLSESLLAIVSQKLDKMPQGGRRAAFEILVATPAIRHLIRENKTAQIYSAMQTGQALGMCTFAAKNSPHNHSRR